MNINGLNVIQNFSVLKTNDKTANPNFGIKEEIKLPRQKVNAQTVLANYKIPKINIPFKGNIQPQEMSDEEFERLEQKLKEKVNILSSKYKMNFFELCYKYLNKVNINIAKKIVSDEKLYSKENLMTSFVNIISSTRTYSQAKLADKILSDERLFGNNDIMWAANEIIGHAKTDEQIKLANKILDNEELFCNSNIAKKARFFIFNSRTKEHAQLADKILSDKRYYENKDIIQNAVGIIGAAQTDKQLKLAEKILFDEKYYGNKNIIDNTERIIENLVTDNQFELANKILDNEVFFNNKKIINHIVNLVYSGKTDNQIKLVDKILADEKLSNNENVLSSYIISYVETNKQAKLVDKILSDERFYNNEKFMQFVTFRIKNIKTEEHASLADKIFSIENIEKIAKQKQNMLEHSEIYINGQLSDDETQSSITKFFNNSYDGLIISNSIFDERMMNAILKKRINVAQNYFKTMAEFNFDDIALLSKLVNSKNNEGKEFSENEKIEFIDLISAYKNYNVSMDVIKDMAIKGKIDKEELNRNLFKAILKNCGLSDNETANIPYDKLTSWDLTYIHFLPRQIRYNKFESDNSLSDLLRAANLEDFNKYIHNTSNKYGKTNRNTQRIFENNGLNYEKWLHPSETNNVHFVSKDKNEEQLIQICNKIKEDMESLSSASFKVRQRFRNNLKKDKFIIPEKCTTNKNELKNFVEYIQKQLQDILENQNPPKKEEIQNVQTNLSKISEEEISKINEAEKTHPLDLTIKMWDRNPQKDLFQGNYSTCCIGMGLGYGQYMPHYLMNTAFNMIEMRDNKTNKIIGNALCYFVNEENGKPAFIIDNIEISNNNKLSKEVGNELRTAIGQYASNVIREVTGHDGISIYMSNNYNDVPTEDLENSVQYINFLGDIDYYEIYLDLYGGLIDKKELAGAYDLFRLLR